MLRFTCLSTGTGLHWFTMPIKGNKGHRALVLQGGAALGAYETGVYRVLYDWISRHINEEENIFDIIAGTSIGL